MQKQFSLRLKPAEAADNDTIKKYIAAAEGKSVSDITGFTFISVPLTPEADSPGSILP
ncbi:MAG: hypothetical protein ACK45S_07055 [Sphingobacteriales bacterium]